MKTIRAKLARIVLLLFTCLGPFAFGSRTASAQANSIPQGTYLKTCRAIYMRGNNLSASCYAGSGNAWFRTEVDVTACEGDVWNLSGGLGCYARRGTWGKDTAVPAGSYFESCQRVRVSGLTLSGSCKDRNQRWRQTSLDLQRCRIGNQLANIDGQIVCIN